MKRWDALAVGIACSAFVACAASHKMSSSQPGANHDAGLPTGRGDHAEIQRLVDDIAKARETDGFTMPAAPLAQPMSELPKSTDAACHHGAGDTCTSACTIADSICDTAKKICDLAATMPADPWAAGKCTDGQASCAEANTKCCGCQ